MANFIVGGVLLLIVGFAVYNLYKKHKHGGGCGCGCSGCDKCGK